MIQEYLLQDATEVASMKVYNPEEIKKRLFCIDNGNSWYVQFSKDGENEEIAKRLSDVDEYIRNHFHVTLLEDGCSVYFNRRLYPLVSEFEYVLRKLLYLTSSINHDENSNSNIADIESKDFGQIFTLLFIDTAFMGKVKEEVKNRNREAFSKADVIALIESIDENTLWNVLLGKDSVPTLQKRFNDVREYRNCVMHSQHLNWKKFREILSLYKTINKELNKAIQNIEVVEGYVPNLPSFNQILNNALRAQEQLMAAADALRPSMEVVHRMSEQLSQNPDLLEAIKRLNESINTYTISPELNKTLLQLNNVAMVSPVFQKTHETVQDLVRYKNEMLPESFGLQEGLNSFPLKNTMKEINEKHKENFLEDGKDDGGNS